MMNKLSVDQRKHLHGSEYVLRFETEQRMDRVSRLMKYIHVEPDYKVADLGSGPIKYLADQMID